MLRATKSLVLIGSLVALAVATLAGPKAFRQTAARIERQGRIDERRRAYGFDNVVRGRVMDGRGLPIPNVRVVARFRMHQTGMVGEGDAETDGDGRYTIEALGDNDFAVGVDVDETPYLRPVLQRAELKGRGLAVTRDFVLQQGPRVTVRVVDAETGAPIAGLDVRSTLYGSGGPVIGRTDARGELSWQANDRNARVDLGNVTDDASREAIGAAPGYAFFHEFSLVDARPQIWATKAYRRPFEPKSVVFRGRAVDEAGRALAGARIHFRQDNEERDLVADREGRFSTSGRRILNLGDTHVDDIVLFADQGGLSATVRPTPEQTWGEIEVRLRRNGLSEAFGRVVDENGQPATGLVVTPFEYFVGGSIGGSSNTQAGTDGRFSLSGLRPGSELRLTFGGGEWGVAHAPPDKPRHKPLTLIAGERRDLGTIVVPHANAFLSFVVRGPDGGPESRPMTVVLEGAHTSLSKRPDTHGAVSFPHAVPEPLTVRVYSCEADFCSYGPGSKNELMVRPARAGQRDVPLRVAWHAPN